MGYWDQPDGTDCVQKTWTTTKIGAGTGLIGSAYHLVAVEPKSAIDGFQRAATATVTMATMGAIFGITTCLTAEARGAPEDPLNYFVGGCASGIFLGAKTHSVMTGVTTCLAFGSVGFLAKAAKVEGWRFISPPKV